MKLTGNEIIFLTENKYKTVSLQKPLNNFYKKHRISYIKGFIFLIVAIVIVVRF